MTTTTLEFNETLVEMGRKPPPDKAAWYFCRRKMINLSRWLKEQQSGVHLVSVRYCIDTCEGCGVTNERLVFALTFNDNRSTLELEEPVCFSKSPRRHDLETLSKTLARYVPSIASVSVDATDREILCNQFGVTFIVSLAEHIAN